jgi:hypothetical protein
MVGKYPGALCLERHSYIEFMKQRVNLRSFIAKGYDDTIAMSHKVAYRVAEYTIITVKKQHVLA